MKHIFHQNMSLLFFGGTNSSKNEKSFGVFFEFFENRVIFDEFLSFQNDAVILDDF